MDETQLDAFSGMADAKGKGTMGKVIAYIIGLDTAGGVMEKGLYSTAMRLADYWAWGCDMGRWIGEAGFGLGLFIIACFLSVPVLRGLWTVCKAVIDSAKEMNRYRREYEL